MVVGGFGVRCRGVGVCRVLEAGMVFFPKASICLLTWISLRGLSSEKLWYCWVLAFAIGDLVVKLEVLPWDFLMSIG